MSDIYFENNENERKKSRIDRRKTIPLMKRRKRRNRIIVILVLLLFGAVGYKLVNLYNKNVEPQVELKDEIKVEPEIIDEKEVKTEEITLSIAGDFTLGTDEKLGYNNSIISAFDNSGKDYNYFMKNVYNIFSSDDYTLVNLETTLTDSKEKYIKNDAVSFNFKGPKDYVNILSNSSIEGVTISNNHIYDYGKQGVNDTVSALKSKDIGICGEGYKIVKDIKGKKFGFLGYMGWNLTEDLKTKFISDVAELRNTGVDVIIPYFHWGSENEYKPNDEQVRAARFAIDNGADAVIGSHPHVMQTIENYKGKLIAYSMGNFCFGGNFNPLDKRTFILQIKTNFEDDELTGFKYKVVPTMISSRNDINDYVPTVAVEHKGEILQKLNELSPTLKGKISDEFFVLE